MRLLGGRLKASLEAAEKALRLSERTHDEPERSDPYSERAHARALRGNCRGALADFRDALHWREQAESDDPQQVLYGLPGIYHTHLLTRLGRRKEATLLAEANNEVCVRVFEVAESNPDIVKSNLLLSELSASAGDLARAEPLCRSTSDWALQRDAQETLCWSALVRAKIELAKGSHTIEARAAIEEGLRIARDCGYGILHIDLLLVRAQAALHEGRPDDAIRDVAIALDEGRRPRPESGLPTLLAATDPECGYAWGIAEGRHLRGEALLLKAAHIIGEPTYKPRSPNTPAAVRELVKQARSELQNALGLWKKLRDPESEAEINPNGEKTRDVLDELRAGRLTRYPIVQPVQPRAQS